MDDICHNFHFFYYFIKLEIQNDYVPTYKSRKIKVIDDLLASAPNNLKLRPANLDDMATYFEWVNDTDVRNQSFNSGPVLWEKHLKWFQHKLQQQSSMMLIMEANKVPVGQIRFDIKEGIAHIDYSLDKKVRGRNWGEILVSKGIYAVREDSNIVFQAEVKRQNIVSASIFIKLGFDEVVNSDNDVRLFRMPSIKLGILSAQEITE